MAITDELTVSNEEIAGALQAEANEPEEFGADDSQVADDDIETTWEDQEGDDDQAQANAEQAAPQDRNVRIVKANGREIEIDMSDDDAVNRILSLGLGARQVFSERDSLRKEKAAWAKEREGLLRYQNLWNTLERSKSNKAALYEKIFGSKYEDDMRAAYERKMAYENASPEQRAMMDYQQKLEALEQQQRDREAEYADREKKAAELSDAAERKEMRSMLLPEFHKYEFSQKVKSPAQAEKLNAALWRMTISNLKAYGEDVEITPELIRKEFRATAELLGGAAERTAKEEVSKITKEKKQAARTQAQLASTRNYSSADKSLSKETDPVKLWSKMFKNK